MSLHTVVTMPQSTDPSAKGIVVAWKKNPGDRVSVGDVVASVNIGNAVMDVEVFAAGYLAGPVAAVGASVPAGANLAYITDAPQELLISGNEIVTHHAPADLIPRDAGLPILMPQLSDTMTEGILVSWEKACGEAIKRGDVVATVETDKAIMDVEVFQEGYLSGPLALLESAVPVGHPIAFIVPDPAKVISAQVTTGVTPASSRPALGSALTAQPSVPAPRPADRRSAPLPTPTTRRVSPYARKTAAQMGINLATVTPSEPGAIITSRDVVRKARPSMAEVAHQLPQVQVAGQGRPMTVMEKAVAHNMTAALTLPTFRVTSNIHLGKLIAAAKAQNISVTVCIAKACSVAMQKHPMMNYAYQPVDCIIERDNHDFGIAVAAEGGGLVVAILHAIETKTPAQLQIEWNELVKRARVRRLSPEDYANPTFNISNMGMYGVTQFDAIPTPGIAAILAIAASGAEGAPFTITADHRVLNGADVALYLRDLKHSIENPEDWMETPSVIPQGDWDFPVVVLGAGPGGEDCARELAGHGTKVALINDAGLPGGECLWRGCIPSKAWRVAADRMRDRAHDKTIGIANTDKPKPDWAAIEAHRKQVLQTRGEMALKGDKAAKIDVRVGYASFVDAHTVKVVPQSGEPYHLTFGAAVIATGARPFVPPVPGAREALANGGVLTSDTVWDLEKLPKRIAIIGAGAIGVEMAQIFHDFGSEVVLIEIQPRILPEVEEEIARGLHQILIREPRLKVHISAKATRISGKPGRMKIKFTDVQGSDIDFLCDYVLAATGKRPETASLNSAALGAALEGAAIKVDTRCRSSVPHVYAVGDVNGGYMLAHTAAAQGRIAAANLLGESPAYNPDLDCGVIFSRPQAGFVGLTMAQAKVKGIDAVEAKMPMSIDAKAMITLETQGLIKIVVDRMSQKIIGVHFLADHTDTLIGEAVMMVTGGLTLTQVAEAIHPHPTQTELFGDLARRLLSRLRKTAAKTPA
ncbi:MAG: FAD-dependent oxidoreductase [Burkholderiales bacterium]